MEKFGIFELLDALSMALEQEISAKPPAEPEKTAPRTDDIAFAPPDYAGTNASNPALASLLTRHDGISKKIDKSSK